jgi:hypothetical protein
MSRRLESAVRGLTIATLHGKPLPARAAE